MLPKLPGTAAGLKLDLLFRNPPVAFEKGSIFSEFFSCLKLTETKCFEMFYLIIIKDLFSVKSCYQ